MAEVIDDRFEVEAEVGSGGMGTVHRGRDRATGATVAIKIVRSRAAMLEQRFERETAILADFDHPHIVRYIASGVTADGAGYLVMDWIDGELLEDRMIKVGLTVAETVQVARRVAGALAYAHGRGVVHRDIKPGNLIAPGGDLARTMLIDFGVARVQQAQSLTETGAIIGTPSFMAPEQARGARSLGPPADIFALGCVLYTCLTGRVPFAGKRMMAVHAKIMFWDPPEADELAPDVPRALAALVTRMLAKAPEDRFADGGALLTALDALPLMVPGGPRRRLSGGAHDTPTTRAMHEPSHRISVVVAAPPDTLVDDAAAPTPVPDDVRADLEDTMLGLGAALDVLPEGAVVASLTEADSEREQARAAVRCALALRRRFPDAMIGVMTDDVRAADEIELIDRALAALAKDALAMEFGDVVGSELPAGAIRLDARTAALVAGEYALIVARGATWLRGDAG